MKKIISILLAVVMLLGLAACGQGTSGTTEPTTVADTKPTAPPIEETEEPKETEATEPVAQGTYDAFGPEEMIIAKTGVSYTKSDSQIDGKDVYELVSQGWNGEIWAKATAHMLNGENVYTVPEIRDALAEKQYKYVAITFQLSEGASIGIYSSVPIISDDFKGELAGFLFNAGGVLDKNANYLDVYGDRFAVYSDGKQIHLGDPINANQWYTFVCELQLDGDAALYGIDSYVDVAMTNGNGLPVYVSEVRYYTGDSYKADFTGENVATEGGDEENNTTAVSTGDGYVEMDATELVAYKPSADVYTNQGDIYGRSNVYGAVFQADWSVEVMAKTTAAKTVYDGSSFATWTDVRNNFASQGYQYIAIDFALPENATIRAIGCVPPAAAGGNVTTTGLNFAAGQPLAWAATCETEEQRACFAVYSEGKEVKVGETINAGQWYTVVIKLLVDGGQYGQGEAGWSSVAFNVGNGKMVYFSTIRYYQDDSFKSDFT